MPAVVRIPVESSLGTGSVNVWHYRITNASPISETNEAIAQLDTFYTAIAGVLAPQTFTIGQRCVTEDQNPNVIIPATSQSATGTGSGTEVLSTCIVVGLTSLIVGGSNRGRKYIGPLDGTAVQSDGRSVVAVDRTTVLTAAAALGTATASGSIVGIWSRLNQSFTPIGGVTVGTIVGSQRRRLN